MYPPALMAAPEIGLGRATSPHGGWSNKDFVTMA
jgi:hypothetical protein